MADNLPVSSDPRHELARLSKLEPDALVAASFAQIATLAAVPVGSIGYLLTKHGLRPAVPGGNVWVATELHLFCARLVHQGEQRIAAARAAMARQPSFSNVQKSQPNQ
jgi:hypothetical protein